MAVVRRASDRRLRRCEAPGWRGGRQAVLAGQAQGIDGFTVRMVTLGPEGTTPRRGMSGERVLLVLSGEVILMDGDGATSILSSGDAALLSPGERHHVAAASEGGAALLSVEGQR